jgi:hypothetical protein
MDGGLVAMPLYCLRYYMYKILIFFCVGFIICQNIFSQTKISFIPPSYKMLDSLVLDFNNDNIQDFIMVLESSLQDSLEEEYPRILIVLQGIDSFNYKIKAFNDSLLLCKNCGGFFDPYDEISFDQDTLLISQWGGSAWRWGVEYACVYNKDDNDWYNVKKYTFSHHNLDPENTWEEETNYLYKKLTK